MAITLVRDHLALPSDQDASGRNLGQEEMANLAEVIASGTLTSTKGRFVKKLEQEFADLLGVKHVYACASGTAAMHTAIAAARSRTWRRNRHQLDHGHGCAHARSFIRERFRSLPKSIPEPGT